MSVRQTQPARRSFNIREYYRMAEAGILAEDDRVELIRGEILEMSPVGSRHAACVRDVSELATERVGNTVIVSVQNPVAIGEVDEPQPDIALLKRRDDRYRHAHPTPRDIFLVIEVADSSLNFDRSTKAALYAGAGIAEYVIVNLADDRLEVHAHPEGGQYKTVTVVRRGEWFTSRILPLLGFSVEEVLG